MSTHPDLRRAITHLMSVCDGAVDRDNVGFSKADAAYGARMAVELEHRDLEPEEQLVIRHLLVKYVSNQLEPAGIEIPNYQSLCSYLGIQPVYKDGIPDDATRRRVLDRLKVEEVRRQRGEWAAQRERERIEHERDLERERARVAAAPDATIYQLDANQIVFAFERRGKRFGDLLAIARALVKRRFDSALPGGGAGWVVPLVGLPELKAKLAESDYRVEWRDGLDTLHFDAPAETTPRADVHISIGNDGMLWLEWEKSGPKWQAIYDEVRSLKSRTFSYDPRPHWKVPVKHFEAVMSKLHEFTIDVSDTASAEFGRIVEAARVAAERQAEEDRRRREERDRELAERSAMRDRVLAAAGDLAAPFIYAPKLRGHDYEPEERRLYRHQQDGVRRMLHQSFEGFQKGAVMADDMGLGKTVQGLLVAKAFATALGTATIVICPVSLKENWLKEASGLGVPIEVFSSASIPPPPARPFVLIADEAHYFQTWGHFTFDPATGAEVIKGTKRTARFIRLAERAVAVFPMTGTPMRNGRPIEAFPLLRAIRHEIAEDKKEYEKRYCAAHLADKGRATVWDVSGAAHMDEWYEKTRNAVIRRLKKECLDLPEKTRVFRECEVAREDRERYEATLVAKCDEYYARVEEGRRQRDEIAARYREQYRRIEADCEAGAFDEEERDEMLAELQAQEAREQKATFSEEGEALVMLTYVRCAASEAKIASAIELADDILAEGRQVVLFTAFAETANRLAAHYGVPALTGETPIAPRKGESISQRQAMVDAFQRGERRVFVGTVGAGGVGITLTAASDVILVDRPWSPGDAVQVEDRCHRIGQRSQTTAYWLQSFDICSKIDDLLISKHERIELLLAGKRKTLRGVKQMTRRQLAQELLPHFLEQAEKLRAKGVTGEGAIQRTSEDTTTEG